MEVPSPAIKFKPSQSGLPIPTLPISSATAFQAAHIASLTSQVEELVNKNNTLTSQHKAERSEWETRLVEERTRAEDAVRRIRDTHNKEVKDWKNGVETVSLLLYTGVGFTVDGCRSGSSKSQASIIR